MSRLKRDEDRVALFDRAPPTPPMRLLAAVAVTALAGFGGAVMLRELIRAVRSRHWPQVPGTVIRSHVMTTRDSEGESHGARVTYRYRVGDTVHESRRIRFGGPFDSSIRVWAEEICSEYPIGVDVQVRVSPDDARTSV